MLATFLTLMISYFVSPQIQPVRSTAVRLVPSNVNPYAYRAKHTMGSNTKVISQLCYYGLPTCWANHLY